MTDDVTRTEPVDVPARLRRSRDGGTYHLADCVRAKNTVPWLWAEEQLAADDGATLVVTIAAANGVKFCRVCDPPTHLERLAQEIRDAQRTE